MHIKLKLWFWQFQNVQSRFSSVSTSRNIAAYCKFLQGVLTLGKILSVTFWPIEYEPFNVQLCVTYQIKAESLTNPLIPIRFLYFNYFRKYLRLSNFFFLQTTMSNTHSFRGNISGSTYTRKTWLLSLELSETQL